MQQEECNGKNCFTSGSKRQAWIFSSSMATNNSHQTVREVFPTTWPMPYIDNTCWWCLMSLQNFLNNLCRLIKMKVSSHSPGGRGKNKTAVPGELSKTEAFFCVTTLLTFLEREANASSACSATGRAQVGVTPSADPPESPSESHWLQTSPPRNGSLAGSFPHVSTYILTLNVPVRSSILRPRTK